MEDRRRATSVWRNIAYVLIFCYSQLALAQARFNVVAKTGDAAPGLNETFGDVGGPLINNGGEVVFTGKGLSFDARAGAPMGIYVGTPGDVQLVSKVGDPAPGSGTDVSLFSISPVAFSDNGQVVISAYLEGPGIPRLDVSGFWIGSAHQPLAYVARVKARAQGFDPSVTYNWTDSPRLGGGRIIFNGVVKGVPAGEGEAALWAGNASNFNVIARSFTTPPDRSDVLYGGFYPPAINAAGQIAFTSTLVGLDKQDVSQDGLWYGTAASQQLVLRTGEVAPQAGDKTIARIFAPTLNRAGQLTFMASLGTFTNVEQGLTLDDLAIYSGTPGNLQLRARTGQPAPGMPAGVFFGGETIYGHGAQSFYVAPLSGQGHIAFSGLVSGPGIDISNNNGLWLGKPGQPLALIAREGAAAPGAPPGGVFVSAINDIDQYNPTFSAPSINNRGQVVFASAYQDDANQIIQGIWGTDVDDTLHLIVYQGQQIDLGGGVMKTLSYFDGGFGSASEEGQNFIFNDAGQLALGAHFTDGTSAVLIADVPEPGLGMILFCVLGLACAGRRRTHGRRGGVFAIFAR
jgi:hypothetical protein